MASLLKTLNPIPRFPEYTGPHKVGTIDVELPVTELDSPSPAPDDSIDTVQYRVFYPCEDDPKTSKPITWLPQPQRAHVAAYTRFLGTGDRLAEVISFLPRLLHYITIPARKNAPLLNPENGTKWPVMVFSHGLAGSRNAYSHFVGSIASYGVIVIAPEHRDGSTPISYIRDVPNKTATGEKSSVKYSKRTVDYKKMPHVPSPEVEAGRTTQLKTRMWELGCIHDSLLKIGEGKMLTNLNSSSVSLSLFTNKMEVLKPGSISFAGHSFGAATVAQFVKSTFYSPQTSEAPASYEPIFTPSSRSAIAQQITPNTSVILLDMWCLPLRASTTRWLWNKPFPCYAPGGPGGAGVLAIESETFFKWRVHLKATKAFLSPDPSDLSKTVAKDGRPGPHIYYVATSAHLHQSDFGILFPYVTKKMFKCEEPERVMRLNVRATLQHLRERGIAVAPTSVEDLELGSETSVTKVADDSKIFSPEQKVRGWINLDTDVKDYADVEYDDDSKVAMKEGATDASVGDEVTNDGQIMEPSGRAEA